jgi:hypothetical protein
LWDGRISYAEGALRLLLIIDYIFDWGRDKYREAVLCELRTLAARNVSSLADDSEILSLADPLDPLHRWWTSPSEEILVDPSMCAQDMSPRSFDRFRPYESIHGVIRSASVVHTRFLGLYITKENINTLLSTFDTAAKAQRIARDLLRLFKDAWVVTSYALDELEYMWTGHRRENLDLYGGGGDKFCASFTIAAYFSPQWEQILELSFVAVAEDAFNDLKTHAALHRGGSVYFAEMPVVNQDHLTGVFRFARQGSLRSNVQAASTRSCLSSRIAHENDHTDAYFLVAEEKFDKGIRYRMDVAMLPDRDAKGRDMVVWFYNRYKIGKREPQESFLRFSSIYEDRTPDSETISIWPAYDNQIDSDAKAFLLRAKSSYNYQRPPSLCLYLLDNAADPVTTLLDVPPSTKPLSVRRQDIQPGWGLYWNDDLMQKVDPNFKIEIEHFRAHCFDIPNIRSKITNAAVVKPQYHASSELPAYCRTKPVGHWSTIFQGPNAYETIRCVADYFVARKRNLKLITCLYANPSDKSTGGLRAEESPSVHMPTKDDLKELKEEFKSGQATDFQISAILAQDQVIRPIKSLRRKVLSVSPEPADKVGYSGDWLNDEELSDWLDEGHFGASETTHGLKRTRTHSDSEPERTPKRRLLEVEASDSTVGDAIEDPRIVGSFPPGTFLRDDMADDELEAFLETGHFPEEKRKDWKRINTYT